MARIVSLAVLVLLIVVLGMTFFQVLAPFLLPLFLAGMTAIVCQPLYRYFLMRTQDRINLSAGLATLVLLGTFLIPLTVGILIASLQLYTFASSVTDDAGWRKLYHQAQDQSETMFSRAVDFGNQFLPEERRKSPQDVAQDIRGRLQNSLSDLGDRSLGLAGTTLDILVGALGAIANALIAITIYGIALFYFFADGTNLLRATQKLIPVHADYQQELFAEFAKAVRAVVVATFLAALAQGIATGVALWFFDFDHIFVLFVLATLSALIPIAGTCLVWVPCAGWLLLNGHWGMAMLLVIYGAAFVGTLDNIVRAYALNTDTKLHPLLAFISVLGGLQAMGLWGVFIGPIVASCLHALVKIFNHELFELSREKFGERMLLGPGNGTSAAAEPAAAGAGNAEAVAAQVGTGTATGQAAAVENQSSGSAESPQAGTDTPSTAGSSDAATSPESKRSAGKEGSSET